jgi:hypothetical protein
MCISVTYMCKTFILLKFFNCNIEAVTDGYGRFRRLLILRLRVQFPDLKLATTHEIFLCFSQSFETRAEIVAQITQHSLSPQYDNLLLSIHPTVQHLAYILGSIQPYGL